MSAQTSNCPKCATPLPRDAPRGLCPECLLLGGFEDENAAASPASLEPRERTIHIIAPLDEPPSGVVPLHHGLPLSVVVTPMR